MRLPITSWGVLLNEAQNVMTLYPWLAVLVVLAFNSMDDGLRDAADPYG